MNMRKIASALIGIMAYSGVALSSDLPKNESKNSYEFLKTGDVIKANFSENVNIEFSATGDLERVITWDNGGCSKKIKVKSEQNWNNPVKKSNSSNNLGCGGIYEIVTEEKAIRFGDEESFKDWFSKEQPRWYDRGEKHVLYDGKIAMIYTRQPLHKFTLQIYKINIDTPQIEQKSEDYFVKK